MINMKITAEPLQLRLKEQHSLNSRERVRASASSYPLQPSTDIYAMEVHPLTLNVLMQTIPTQSQYHPKLDGGTSQGPRLRKKAVEVAQTLK